MVRNFFYAATIFAVFGFLVAIVLTSPKAQQDTCARIDQSSPLWQTYAENAIRYGADGACSVLKGKRKDV